MPPTTTHMEYARNAAILRNKFRGSPEFETEATRNEYKMNNTSKDFRRYSESDSWSTDYRSSIKPVAKYDAHVTRDIFLNDSRYNLNNREKVPHKRQDKKPLPDKNKVEAVQKSTKSFSRPKSARPESRWQRREEDNGDDDFLPNYESDSDSEISHATDDRPMSSRPDSRTSRIPVPVPNPVIVPQHESTRPPRPKTSHGRQPSDASSVDCQETMPTPRPKSRRGNKEGIKFEPNEKWKRPNDTSTNYIKPSSDAFKMSKKPAKIQNEVKSQKCQQNEKLSSRTQNKISDRWTTSDIDDIIFGGNSDAILDVDPVEYFNTPDDNVKYISVSHTKPSLSKGAINVITNESPVEVGKYQCIHGNDKNKRAANSEMNDRSHGNGVFGPKNIKANASITSTSQTRHTHDSINARSNYYRDGGVSKKQALGKSDTRVMSLNTGERVHLEFPFKTGPKKSEPRLRQPRKLKPLSPLHSNAE